MISDNTTLKEEFKIFYKEHPSKNFEDFVEKFAIFGGVGRGDIDTSKPSYELIEKFILKDYNYIRNDVSNLTGGAPLYQALLSAIAMGDGDYSEVKKRWQNREAEFSNLIFTQLSHELLKENFAKEDPIVEISSYWDKNAEFDIFAKTDSGKTILGSTKYTNAKIKKK